MKKGTVPATGRAIKDFGTVGTVGIVILRFFPGEFRTQLFSALTPREITKSQHSKLFEKASFLAGL
ncbi:TPA: hypothetical protein ACW4EX_001894 [Salmonella enterica subsp. enterica serovar Litchfield]|uniref:hypothetical protein n=1 Tax=Citrobacter freundii complex TaxID=1344959 RepID=UPI00115ECD62|nr:hypothetical protein FMM65_09465 [Citrobacter youngae]